MQSNAELNEVQLVDITRYLVALSLAAREGDAPRATGTPTATAPQPVPERISPAPPAAPPAAVDSGGIAPSPAP